jgi:tripartite-type tricarboxylate transporter receptor subunit TctC
LCVGLNQTGGSDGNAAAGLRLLLCDCVAIRGGRVSADLAHAAYNHGVPFAPGGPVDTIGRIIAARLGDIFGQQVVIENVGGAGGMIGAAGVAKAAPDGYQVVLATSATHAQNQTLYKNPLYDAATAFAPVSLLTDSPRVLITRKDLPAGTLAEFMGYARMNQAKMQYGSAGAGSEMHVCALLLDRAMGTAITHIPYRCAGPAMQDLISGRLDYICEQISTAVPQVQAGTVRAIAILGPDRVSVLPGTASAREWGLEDFDCGAWDRPGVPKGNARCDRSPACRGGERGRGYAVRAGAVGEHRRDCRCAAAPEPGISGKIHRERN